MKHLIQLWNGETGIGKWFAILKLTNEQYERVKSDNINVLKDFGNFKIIAIAQKDYIRIKDKL